MPELKDPRIRILDQYKILNAISKGAYGVVYRAQDKKTKEIVAVKEEIDGLCRSTSTEIDILKTLPRHPCIVGFKKVEIGEGRGDGAFVVMEYMEYDLARYRKSLRKPFKLIAIKYVMERILEGVWFLHDQGVMHRDLKPSNILVSETNDQIKICDFGLSAPFGTKKASYCPRVGTRWYRAPELLRGSWNYSSAIDMWAVGCIMAELVLDQVLFPGTSEDNQLDYIHQIMNPEFNRLAIKMETVASFQGTAALTPSGIDLLERLLAYEPETRITAKDALNHPWFRE